ncbi:hypothetical protein PENTCL1PPCAC_14820, partial [Pristionchus entomophagus]
SRLCPNANCMLQWTRWSLRLMSWTINRQPEYDSELLMETTHWDGVKVRVYIPRDETMSHSDGAIVYMHGGGLVFGSTEMYESQTRTMARLARTRLFVSIDYRLAPETVFPGQLEDCERVLEFVIANGPRQYGIDPNKIVVMGDSAGGNLAAAIAQRRRNRETEPKILGQVLLYPWLQMADMQTYSYRYWYREMDGLSFLDPLSLGYYALWYAGVDVNARPDFALAVTVNGHLSDTARSVAAKSMDFAALPQTFRDDVNGSDSPRTEQPISELADYMEPFLTNASFAPLMATDLSGLPSTLVVSCEFDLLRDEGALYAHRLKQAGNVSFSQSYGCSKGMETFFDLPMRFFQESLGEIMLWTNKLLREA